MHTKFQLESLKGVGNTGTGGRILLKWFLKKQGVRVCGFNSTGSRPNF